MRVAVAPGKFAKGVDAPGVPWHKHDPARHGYPTYDWRCDPPTPEERRHAAANPTTLTHPNTRGVRPDFIGLPLEEALGRRYDTDAHLVSYVVSLDHQPLARQPRVNKGGVQWLLDQGYDVDCDVLIVDLDNPAHAEWTPALRRELDELLARMPAPLGTCGIYLTAKGYRLLQPLDEPVRVTEVERYMDGWLDELEAGGLRPDTSCRDWTRHMRLPHVRREGRDYVSPLVDLSRMSPRLITPKAPAGGPLAGPRRRSLRAW